MDLKNKAEIIFSDILLPLDNVISLTAEKNNFLDNT